MIENVKKSIGNHLASQTKATALSQLKMGCDCSVAVWTNSSDLVSYEHTEGHAFSFYLAGGEGVSRLDRDSGHAWPGSVCVMPQGHSSVWQVEDRIDFLHVYLSDQELRRQFAHTFDKDARLLEVREHTFIDSERLSGAFLQLRAAAYDGNQMLAEEAIAALICDAATSNVLGELLHPALTGGLSPRKLNLVKEYMAANLDRNITLKELANLVNLSEYHFQRNFKAQCGVSPQVWLTRLRVDHAKELMRQNQNLAQIADACAFSSQSHFSRTFKKYTGASPGVYVRNLLM